MFSYICKVPFIFSPAHCTVSVFNVISAGSSQNVGSPCEKFKNIESKNIPIFPKKKCQIQLRKPTNFVDKP